MQFYSKMFKKLKSLKIINNSVISKCNITSVTKEKNVDLTQNLYEKYKDKIYYSSVFETQFERLHFKKQKIITQIIERHNVKKIKLDNNYKPFPIALKLMNKTHNAIEEIHANELDKLKNDMEQKMFRIGAIKSEIDSSLQSKVEPKRSWMQDYEYFNDCDLNTTPEYGTPDPNEPFSNVICGGCGATLQCAEPSLSGYLPKEIFKHRTDDELKVCIC